MLPPSMKKGECTVISFTLNASVAEKTASIRPSIYGSKWPPEVMYS